jgi:hypothetical protein
MIDSTMLTKTWMRTVITGIPVAGIMAPGAIVSKHSLVETRIAMAASAKGRCPAETFTMAALAGQVGMTSCQFEGGQIVVESGWHPGSGRMAGIAAGSKTSGVLVFCFMAGKTYGGCTLESSSWMALAAINSKMRAGQVKDGKVMVKRGGLPSISRVT